MSQILPVDEHHTTDLYDVLGVSRNASQEEIKTRYNELVLVYHPDKGGDVKKFNELQVAYKVLSNEQSRELYAKSLSSTYDELMTTYRDTNGVRQSVKCESSDVDFTRGKTDDEIIEKKRLFMQQFEEKRNPDERKFFSEMSQEIHRRELELPTKSLKYEDILRQEVPPVVNCLMNDKFDPDLFNRVFEHNKQSQVKDLQPYDKVEEQSRTDLAPIDDVGIFTHSTIDERDFQTYTTHANIDVTQLGKPDDTKYEDPKLLYELMCKERESLGCTLLGDDVHPFSYKKLGI
jgi:curved DNA-binding protein CbpA